MISNENCVIAELGDTIDALATNKDRCLVATAGRSCGIFLITFSILKPLQII